MGSVSPSWALAALLVLGSATDLEAQMGKPRLVTPSADSVSAAYKVADGLFANLKSGKNEDIAKWLVEQVGYAWDAQTRIKNTNEYKSKLDMILLSPPAGQYGKMAGYDLIEESSLPGTDRYFRLTYISYHEGAPLVWELRFYVKPDGKLALSSCGWSDKNPFEYLSTGDMQLLRWYGR
jgi:hypothetical protein